MPRLRLAVAIAVIACAACINAPRKKEGITKSTPLTGVVFVDGGRLIDVPLFDPNSESLVVTRTLWYVPDLNRFSVAAPAGSTFPLAKKPADEEQLFNFSAELPF